MKNFRILSLLAAAAMMVYVASASADYVATTTSGKPAAPTIHLVNEGGHVVLQNGLANISCSSTIEGGVDSYGPGQSVSGTIDHFTFTGCTNSWHVTTENVGGAYGALTVDSTSGHNGTVTSMWSRIITTRFGITCVYETFLTHIGVITGGNPATLHFNASIPIDEDDSSGLCGSGNAKWEGTYVTTSALYVANS